VLLTVLITICTADPIKLPPPRMWKPPEVKLVEAGAEPRKALRYALKRGLNAEAALDADGTWRMHSGQGNANATLPALSTPFHLTVETPSQWGFRFSAASSKNAPGMEDDVVTARTMEALDGVNGTVTLDDRGVPLKLSIYPSQTDPLHQKDLTQIEVRSYYAMELARTAFMHLCTPFPTEAVGIGASWQLERPQTRGSISYVEVDTFTLRNVDASGVRLSVRHGGKPDPYGIIAPENLDLQVSGEGELDVAFAQPLPVRLDESLHLHAVTGPKNAARVEHEGALGSHFRLKESSK
jgi:hypothetical protein